MSEIEYYHVDTGCMVEFLSEIGTKHNKTNINLNGNEIIIAEHEGSKTKIHLFNTSSVDEEAIVTIDTLSTKQFEDKIEQYNFKTKVKPATSPCKKLLEYAKASIRNKINTETSNLILSDKEWKKAKATLAKYNFEKQRNVS